jgi:nucleotide-binding universal stress UspA family protein
MRILAACDSISSCAAVIERLSDESATGNTHVELIGVVHSEIPLVPDPAFALVAAHAEQIRRQREYLPPELERGARSIREANPSLDVTWRIIEGRPAEVILEEARRWSPTTIVVGATDKRTLLESAADVLATSACIPVEIAVHSV